MYEIIKKIDRKNEIRKERYNTAFKESEMKLLNKISNKLKKSRTETIVEALQTLERTLYESKKRKPQ